MTDSLPSPEALPDYYGVVANVISDRALRTGAKVWIIYCNGDAACPRVIGMSKGGRIIEKYTHYKRLENYRAKWVPEHLRERIAWRWTDKFEAARLATGLGEMWKGVRFYHRDGTILRDGITESQVFKRAREKREW